MTSSQPLQTAYPSIGAEPEPEIEDAADVNAANGANDANEANSKTDVDVAAPATNAPAPPVVDTMDGNANGSANGSVSLSLVRQNDVIDIRKIVKDGSKTVLSCPLNYAPGIVYKMVSLC